LAIGDISLPTSTSPERFFFKNIRPITAAIDPPKGEELLWSVISHAALNFISLGDVKTLRAVLSHYNFKRGQDQTLVSGNELIIEGIDNLTVKRESRLVRGDLLQGQHIVMSCREENWPSLGVMHLWGTVLNLFLSSYAGVNSYVRFEMEDKNTGTSLKWPISLGQKPLI
jgi:type VI secretion system protein ImpG